MHPPPADRFLEERLLPGETVRWSARPLPGEFAARQAPAILFGLGLLGLAGVGGAEHVVARGADWSAPSAWLLALFLGWGVAGGLFLLVSPLAAAARARRTLYAVTNQRAIILAPRRFRAPLLQSFPAAKLGGAESRPQPDGSGDVVLRTLLVPTKGGGGVIRQIGFFAVADSAAALQAVRDLARDAPREPSPVMRRAPAWQRTLFPVLTLLLGCMALGIGYTSIAGGRRSETWPSAPGTILEAARTRTGGRSVSSYAQIHYSYRVSGQVFSGDRIAYAHSISGPHVAELLRRYPAGAPVSVRYNPADPRDAMLEPGVDPSAWLILGLAAVVVTFGAALSWAYSSSYRARPVARLALFAF